MSKYSLDLKYGSWLGRWHHGCKHWLWKVRQPEFSPQNPREKLDVTEDICNLSCVPWTGAESGDGSIVWKLQGQPARSEPSSSRKEGGQGGLYSDPSTQATHTLHTHMRKSHVCGCVSWAPKEKEDEIEGFILFFPMVFCQVSYPDVTGKGYLEHQFSSSYLPCLHFCLLVRGERRSRR